VSYEVTDGPSPAHVVHKAAQHTYQQPGGETGAVIAGVGAPVERSANEPCEPDYEALKFEVQELSESTSKTFGPNGEEDGAGNSPSQAGGPPVARLVGAIESLALLAGLVYRRN